MVRARSARPPTLSLPLDLQRWLEAPLKGEGPTWSIPVLAPYRLLGNSTLSGAGRTSHEFDPRLNPWMPTDFAHIASGTNSSEKLAGADVMAGRAMEFATRFGLTGPWKVTRPPREQEVGLMLEQASDLRRVLAEVRPLGELDQQTKGKVTRAREILQPLLDSLYETVEPALVTRIDTRFPFVPSMTAQWEGHLDLYDLMRIQLLADLADGLRVLECEEPSCGKLFIWSQGRRGHPGRRAALRGPLPQFCSFQHANTFDQRARRARERKSSGGR